MKIEEGIYVRTKEEEEIACCVNKISFLFQLIFVLFVVYLFN